MWRNGRSETISDAEVLQASRRGSTKFFKADFVSLDDW